MRQLAQAAGLDVDVAKSAQQQKPNKIGVTANSAGHSKLEIPDFVTHLE